MGWIHLIVSQIVRYINGIEPSLRFQDRVSIVSVVIQQGLDVRFVMVRVRLRTDEGSIESDTDLLEEGVHYVVDQKGFVRVHGIASSCFLELPFQFKVTAREVNVIFLRIDLKIDGVDACGERTDGDHAITPDAEIGRRDPKEVQHGVLHPR